MSVLFIGSCFSLFNFIRTSFIYKEGPCISVFGGNTMKSSGLGCIRPVLDDFDKLRSSHASYSAQSHTSCPARPGISIYQVLDDFVRSGMMINPDFIEVL